METKKCPMCGIDIEAGLDTCPACGFRFESDQATEAQAPEVEFQAQKNAAPTASASLLPKSKLDSMSQKIDMIYNVIIGIGIIAIILGFVCFSKDTGSYIENLAYGGDAYTGIQNAAAGTGRNVHYLAEIVAFGFGSVDLIAGLALCAFGLMKKMVLAKEVADTEKSISEELPEI